MPINSLKVLLAISFVSLVFAAILGAAVSLNPLGNGLAFLSAYVSILGIKDWVERLVDEHTRVH